MNVAERELVTEFAGVGCLLQGLGILAPIVLGIFAGTVGLGIGLVLFLVLFFFGSSKSKKWRCGNCKNPLPGDEVSACPVCKARLD